MGEGVSRFGPAHVRECQMGKALGVLLLGASLSAAVYGWMSLEEAMDQAAPAQVVADTGAAPPAPLPRVISSSRSLAAAQTAPAPMAVSGGSGGPAQESVSSHGAHGAGAVPPGAAVQEDSQAIPTPAPVMVPRPRAANEEARRVLARDIQTELKRVGCYDGDVDGQWNTATRKAMGAFNERVNATLPTEAPDFILLTLVQGHTARACGRTCPTGQALAGDGRCLPRALLTKAPTAKVPVARLAPKQGGEHAEAVVEQKRPKSAPPLPGRMAVGAPADAVLVSEKAQKDAEARRRAEHAAIEARRVRLEAERKARLDADRKATVAGDAVKSAELASLEERRARLEAERKARIASGIGPAGGAAPAVLSALGGPPPPAVAPSVAATKDQADDAAADAQAAAARRIAAARERAARLKRERVAAARRQVGPVYSPPMYVMRPQPQPQRRAVTVYPRRSTGAVFSAISRSAP